MDLGTGYFDPLANTSRRKELFVMLRSPVMWPAGLYMNGELAQVQSGGLDLRSCNTFLYLNILVAIRM
jgi:hypothetical protein